MNGELVATVVIGSFVVFFGTAQAVRLRNVRRRGRTLVRATGLAHTATYFAWVPYLVVALRPGPELDVAEALRGLGLALAIAGVAFAMWSLATLGRHYDLELEVHGDHEVVKAGPYALVRHPLYLGLALHLIGACLATGNLLLMVGSLGVAFPIFYLRAATEERLLSAELGEAYDAYARTVPMLVPLPRGGGPR